MSNGLVRIPIPVSRCVQISGVLGVILGLIIGYMNNEGFTWTFLRAAIMGVVFALIVRYALTIFIRYWLETQMDKMIQARLEFMEARKKEQEKKKTNKAE
ncbi:MAG: hypothetical protein AAGA18_04355 [Verrucomicrobiota bacterium]